MRKKLMMLALSLAALAGALTAPRLQADTTHSCQLGCRSCVCNSAGVPIACTNVYCNPQV
jgi:hypothetical protein